MYPKGYKPDLRDGRRIGEEGDNIEKWHDWYGLGKVIFDIHILKRPEDESQSTLRDQHYDLRDKWERLSHDPTPEMIVELKEFLGNSQDAGWKVGTSLTYCKELTKLDKPRQATKPCATGSPP